MHNNKTLKTFMKQEKNNSFYFSFKEFIEFKSIIHVFKLYKNCKERVYLTHKRWTQQM